MYSKSDRYVKKLVKNLSFGLGLVTFLFTILLKRGEFQGPLHSDSIN